jgi:hypothetical protein
MSDDELKVRSVLVIMDQLLQGVANIVEKNANDCAKLNGPDAARYIAHEIRKSAGDAIANGEVELRKLFGRGRRHH